MPFRISFTNTFTAAEIWLRVGKRLDATALIMSYDSNETGNRSVASLLDKQLILKKHKD